MISVLTNTIKQTLTEKGIDEHINDVIDNKIFVEEELDKQADEYMQEIKKCCPLGYFLDDQYNCVSFRNYTDDVFVNTILEVGEKMKEKYVISSTSEWRRCPVQQRMEFEVVSIPSDRNSTVFVFSDIDVDYDVTEKIMKINEFSELQYSCLEVSSDYDSITALTCVNENHKLNFTGFIRKCCKEGLALSTDFSTCVPQDGIWVSPRKVIHHKTDRMTGSYTLISGHELCDENKTPVFEPVESITTDGHFKPSKSLDGVLLPYHCVDRVLHNDEGNQKVVAVICLQGGCESEVCVSKCCKKTEVLEHGEPRCEKANETSQLWTYHDKIYNDQLVLLAQRDLEGLEFGYQHNFLANYLLYPGFNPKCRHIVRLDRDSPIRILLNDSIFIEGRGITQDYCVDNRIEENGEIHEVVLMCNEAIDGEIEEHDEAVSSQKCLNVHIDVLRIANTISCLISCVFLIATFLVYMCLPDLNNLHGKIILSNVFTIFVVTLYLLLIYNGSQYLDEYVCIIVGYCGYFMTMSMFTWMTIMSFDLCWTFLRARAPNKSSATFKFVIYSITAWGLSAMMTFTVMILDMVIEEFEDQDSMFFARPNVGFEKCFIQDKAHGLYLHMPIMLLMLFNSSFFIITTLVLHR